MKQRMPGLARSNAARCRLVDALVREKLACQLQGFLQGTPNVRQLGQKSIEDVAAMRIPKMEIRQMRIRKREIYITGATTALAMFAVSGTAIAQQAGEESYEVPKAEQPYSQNAGDRQTMESKTHQQGVNAGIGEDEGARMAAEFGVEELGDIENWKITNGGTEVGEIDRLAIDRTTKEIVAVVGLTGVVGVNMKEVAIPLKDLRAAGEETLATDLSKDELQQKPDVDPWDGTFSQVVSDSIPQ